MDQAILWGLAFAGSSVIGIASILVLQQAGIRAATKGLRRELSSLSMTHRETSQRLAEAETQLESVQLLRQSHSGLQARLREMKQVWLDGASDEHACQRVLKKNLWVLWPEYFVKEEFFATPRTLSTISSRFFEGRAQPVDQTTYKLFASDSLKPDLFGTAESYAFHRRNPDDVYLLLELKRPSVALSWTDLEQVHAYAFGLMQRVADLRDARIDCLVIGGHCADGLNDAHLRWGGNAHHAIRITPITWQDLYERAARLVVPFIDHGFADDGQLVPKAIDEGPIDPPGPASAEIVSLPDSDRQLSAEQSPPLRQVG